MNIEKVGLWNGIQQNTMSTDWSVHSFHGTWKLYKNWLNDQILLMRHWIGDEFNSFLKVHEQIHESWGERKKERQRDDLEEEGECT